MVGSEIQVLSLLANMITLEAKTVAVAVIENESLQPSFVRIINLEL